MSDACHAICTLSPLRAALTMQFAKNTQRDTSKVLLPHKMTMEFSKMLRMKRKMQLIYWKTTQKYRARHTERLTVGHVETCGNVTKRHACSTRNDATRRFKPPKVTILPSLRTSAEVANGSDPQSKTRTLRYAFGKKTTQ